MIQEKVHDQLMRKIDDDMGRRFGDGEMVSDFLLKIITEKYHWEKRGWGYTCGHTCMYIKVVCATQQ